MGFRKWWRRLWNKEDADADGSEGVVKLTAEPCPLPVPDRKTSDEIIVEMADRAAGTRPPTRRAVTPKEEPIQEETSPQEKEPTQEEASLQEEEPIQEEASPQEEEQTQEEASPQEEVLICEDVQTQEETPPREERDEQQE